MSKINIRYRLLRLVNMSDDLDREGASSSIRSGIQFQGANVFILACAIIIASVGLNVNSIPVIIGAMLISPVMAPILGFGFGLGIRDNQLVKSSLKNFLIMVSISIGASFLYFLLSPLRLENPTELLARTNPTLYDVLIALFGGFAGILELSRKKKGTVISGVAIATALMPPLCTVGYGLSLLNARYIFGALYLFIINSIFIALATFITVKYLKYPVVAASDTQRHLSRRSVIVLLLIVIIPSIFSAVQIVRQSNFSRHVQQLVSSHPTIGSGFIYDHKTHFTSRHSAVEFFLAGPVPSEQEMESFYIAAEELGIFRNQIILKSNVSDHRGLESELVKDLYEASEQRITTLTDSIAKLNDSLKAHQSVAALNNAVAHEVMVQHPIVTRVVLGNAHTLSSVSDANTQTEYVVLLETPVAISQAEIDKLQAWLCVRLGQPKVSVIQTVTSN